MFGERRASQELATTRRNPNLTGLCAECNAACCQKGTGLRLTEEEFELLQSQGTVFNTVSYTNYPSLDADPTRRVHYLADDCGALDPELLACRIHESPDRPEVCKVFTPGNDCEKIRRDRLTPLETMRFRQRCARRAVSGYIR